MNQWIGWRALSHVCMLAAAASLLIGCSPSEIPETPTSVVLVSIDTLRADALSPYGGPVETPGFDQVALDGVLFERAFSPAAETAPSHATLFTGREVPSHGVYKNGIHLRDEAQTLAEVFRDEGYETAAFVSSWVLDPRFSWDRGFEVYDAEFPNDGGTMAKERAYPDALWLEESFAGLDRRGVMTVRAAAQWLARTKEPFFLFIHLFDPHAPYWPPKKHQEPLQAQRFQMAGRSAPGFTSEQLEGQIRNYHGEVRYADEVLDALLRAVDKKMDGDPPLVVIVADHGEGLGEHDLMEHALNLHDEQLHIPLLFRWRGRLPAGIRMRTSVGLVDVAPTILELVGLPPFAAVEGRSLAKNLLAASEPEARSIFANRRSFSETYRRPLGRQVALRSGGWKYIRRVGATDQLFDLGADPDEGTNRLHEAGAASRAKAMLEEIIAFEASMPEIEEVAPLPDDVRENLRALGYAE